MAVVPDPSALEVRQLQGATVSPVEQVLERHVVAGELLVHDGFPWGQGQASRCEWHCGGQDSGRAGWRGPRPAGVSAGAVLAVVALLVLTHDKERVQHVLGLQACQPVDVEEGGVEIRAQQRAALRVPAEWRAGVAHLLGVGLQPPRGVRQLQDIRKDPASERAVELPQGRLGEGGRDGASELLNDEGLHVAAAHLLASNVVKDHRRPHRMHERAVCRVGRENERELAADGAGRNN